MKTITTTTLLLLILSACETHHTEQTSEPAQATNSFLAQASSVTNPCTGLGFTRVQVSPQLPANFPATGLQLAANCLAWQEFIYLNWLADPQRPGYPDSSKQASDFGKPGNTAPTVWESYFEASEVFAGPSNWNASRNESKSLSRLSKLGDATMSLHSIGQAGDNKWITDQRGGLAYYEILMNEDEYDFITQNVFNGSDLTTYAGQLSCAQQSGTNGRGGLVLPSGGKGSNPDVDCAGNPATYGQSVGAIEIKAAWVALPTDGSLDYRYKTSNATLTQPDGRTEQATVGLVGLHIIHKMPGADQFVWATFEQIDNTPDNNNGTPVAPELPDNPNRKPNTASTGPFTFFNTECDVSTDPYYQCEANKLPGAPCPPGTTETSSCYPYSAPMQLTRITPVDEESNSVTGYVWSLLPTDSVFNYYRLIDVQWPNMPTRVTPGSVAPLTAGDIRPADATRIVANSTLETYQQVENSCMDCHKFASIAHPSQQQVNTVNGITSRSVHVKKPNPAGTPNYASDYSFIFSTETTR